MYYFMKLAIRTVVMIVPAIVVGIIDAIGLVGFCINNFAYFVFRQPCYWDLENELNAMTETGKIWYMFWLYGFDSDDG